MECDEILEQYRLGNFGESYTRALLRPHVREDLQDLPYVLPPRLDEPRKLISISEFEERMAQLLGEMEDDEDESAA